MSRSVVGYIKGFLNTSASSTPYLSTDAETGLPIATGIGPGVFQEFGDGEALQYSSRGVTSVNILTAGSGQTAGTYTATASAGGAVIQYVVAGGGTITAQPTVLNPGGPYTDAAVPTFTIAAGGTPGTVQANIGVLYSGIYQLVQLDPLYAGANILPGQPLYYVEAQAGIVVTPTSVASNVFDWAGTNIDPNFGPSLPYAFIQVGPGKHRPLVGGTAVTVNVDAITLPVLADVGDTTYLAVAIASAAPYEYLGMPLASIAEGATGLARFTRSLARY